MATTLLRAQVVCRARPAFSGPVAECGCVVFGLTWPALAHSPLALAERTSLVLAVLAALFAMVAVAVWRVRATNMAPCGIGSSVELAREAPWVRLAAGGEARWVPVRYLWGNADLIVIGLSRSRGRHTIHEPPWLRLRRCCFDEARWRELQRWRRAVQSSGLVPRGPAGGGAAEDRDRRGPVRESAWHR